MSSQQGGEEPQQPSSSNPTPPTADRPPRRRPPQHRPHPHPNPNRQPTNRSRQSNRVPANRQPPVIIPPLNQPPPNRSNRLLTVADTEIQASMNNYYHKFEEVPRDPPEVIYRQQIVPANLIYTEYQFEYRGPWAPVLGPFPLFCPFCHISVDYLNRCHNLSCHNFGHFTGVDPMRDGHYSYGRYPILHVFRVYNAAPEDAPVNVYFEYEYDAPNQ